MRALAWDGDLLYSSRGYDLLRARIPPGTKSADVDWQFVAAFSPAAWRKITTAWKLSLRLFRDGFHALAISSRSIIAAVPGAIVTLPQGESEFHVTHQIIRGTRPLHIAAVPGGQIFWGEYFDNAARDEVHIYTSEDAGTSWHIAYTFPKASIRHVHNIVHDRWQNCLWILTGDYGDECRILRAACDLSSIEVIVQGNQQARAVALVPTPGGIYFSSDTPLESNFIYHMDQAGKVSQLSAIGSSSIYGCRVGESVFFSTMVEPSAVNKDKQVRLYGSTYKRDSKNGGWPSLLTWKKDGWSMKFFQYGNVFLPDGDNATQYLAATTIATESDDMAMSLYSFHAGH